MVLVVVLNRLVRIGNGGENGVLVLVILLAVRVGVLLLLLLLPVPIGIKAVLQVLLLMLRWRPLLASILAIPSVAHNWISRS